MPTIERTRTAASTTLDQTTIATTPILGRKFEDLLTLTPGVSIVQGPDGDEITFAGQRGVFNNISLDGGDYNNGFFGEQVGGQRAAIDITLDAVKEFQVIATGASAEFGRTAGGVVNVITKSGTNQVNGSLFHYQRLEALTSNTSDGKPLKDFHREQFGGTVGGPLVKDRAFYFLALEGVRENLLRPNLSEPIGTPCPVSAPTLAANEALINGSADCQRLALLDFFRSARGQEEGLPVEHTVNNNALLGKIDWNLLAREQPVGVVQLQLLEEHEPDLRRRDLRQLGQRHRGTVEDQRPEPQPVHHADREPAERVPLHLLARGSAALGRRRRTCRPTRRWDSARRSASATRSSSRRTSTSWCSGSRSRTTSRSSPGAHTIKAGGEWMHTNNVQVFRGFFQGRYIFDSVTGFLRYASPPAPGGFGPFTVGCSNGVLRHRAGGLPGRHDAQRRPAALLSAEQQPGRRSRATRRARPTSTTRSSRSSSRTSGRPAAA